MIRILFAITLSALVGTGCSSSAESSENNSRPSGEFIEVRYATGFTIMKDDDGFSITVRNPQDTLEILANYRISTTADSGGFMAPLESFVLNSTTFAAYFDRLGINDYIKGMTYTDRVMNENLRQRIDSGEILEVISGDGLDFETVLDINPEAVLAYSFGEADFSKYDEADIPVVLLMEYKESHPLGRAEWIKVVGCLTGKSDMADSVFNEIEQAYVGIRNQAMLHSYLPSAFTGSKYGDFWYAPGRDSYVAKYIRDAGASYTFDHIEGQASAELDFESAMLRISEAEFWGMIVSSEEPFTREDVLEMNPVYENLQSFKNNRIFVCNTAEKDYFGDAVMEPHLILSDLYHIFHPREGQVPDFHYFKPIR